jgi:predicted nucleotide-binding protein/FixJ family two-component response regulator
MPFSKDGTSSTMPPNGQRPVNERRLLIVEDDTAIAKLLLILVTEVGGYVARVAHDGGDAIEEAVRWQPDVILLDVTLPVLNGFDVLEELKRRRVTTRVIMCSAQYTRVEDAVRAIRAGACDYLIKPVDHAELLGRLKRCLLLDSALNLHVSEQAPFVQALVERQEAPLVYEALEQIRQRRRRERFSRRIFIVHGRDDSLKRELASFLKRLELVPVILHEQPDKGQTLLAKLQSEMQDVGFAFVLLTPDDVGGLVGEPLQQSRARQNVLFEHGLLVGILGASRVCAIERGAVERPSDLHGVLYKTLPSDGSIRDIELEIGNELAAAGYSVDMAELLLKASRKSRRRILGS